MSQCPEDKIPEPLPPQTDHAIFAKSPNPHAWRKWATRLRRPATSLFFFLFVFVLVAVWTPIRPVATYEVGSDSVEHFDYSPDGSVIAISCRNDTGYATQTIHVLDVEQMLERYAVQAAWPGWKNNHFSPDSRFFAAYTEAGDIKVWATQTGAEVAIIPTQGKRGRADRVHFQFSPDSQFLAFDSYFRNEDHKHTTTLWNIDKNREHGTIHAEYSVLKFATDGKSALSWNLVEEHSEVQRWRIGLDQALTPEMVLSIPRSRILFSPDLSTLAACSYWQDKNPEIAVWDIAAGVKRWSASMANEKPRRSLKKYDGRLLVVELYDGPRGLSTIGPPGPVKLWDLSATPKEIGVLEAPPIMSHDSKWLAVPLSAGVELISTSALYQRRRLVNSNDQHHPFENAPCTFSPDGTMIAVHISRLTDQASFFESWLPAKLIPSREPRSGGFRLWDVETGSELMEFESSRELHFSPDGKYVATRQPLGTISFWKLPLRKSLWAMLSWSGLIWFVGLSLYWAVKKWRWGRIVRLPRLALRSSSLLWHKPKK